VPSAWLPPAPCASSTWNCAAPKKSGCQCFPSWSFWPTVSAPKSGLAGSKNTSSIPCRSSVGGCSPRRYFQARSPAVRSGDHRPPLCVRQQLKDRSHHAVDPGVIGRRGRQDGLRGLHISGRHPFLPEMCIPSDLHLSPGFQKEGLPTPLPG